MRARLTLLAAAALLLGFLIPYMLYLNHQVGERFGPHRLQSGSPIEQVRLSCRVKRSDCIGQEFAARASG